MTISVNADLRVNSSITHSNAVDLATYKGSVSVNSQASLSATDVTKIYADSLNVTTSPTVLDVTALTDQGFGQSQNFANVKYLHVEHTGSSGTLTVGGGTLSLIPAIALIAGGWVDLKTTISTTGAKNLSLTASTGTIPCDVVLLGN